MKSIRTIIDEKGNVYADFIGYAGEECAPAEEELRKALAELGLLTQVEALKRKSAAQITAETETQAQSQPQISPQSRRVKLG